MKRFAGKNPLSPFAERKTMRHAGIDANVPEARRCPVASFRPPIRAYPIGGQSPLLQQNQGHPVRCRRRLRPPIPGEYPCYPKIVFLNQARIRLAGLTISARARVLHQRLLLCIEVDQDNRTLRGGADVDHLATIFQDVFLGQVEMAAEMKAR